MGWGSLVDVARTQRIWEDKGRVRVPLENNKKGCRKEVNWVIWVKPE